MEACVHLLAPELLDDAVNGRVAGRHGNRDRSFAPHGVYPAAGDDQWVAIAIEDDAEWHALCVLAALDPALVDLGFEERMAGHDELDELIAAWTSTVRAGELQDMLQTEGIPAHQVQSSSHCIADPQLAQRQQFRRVQHPRTGFTWVEGSPFRLSRTPGEPAWGGPTFGQHLDEVLRGILGYDDDRITELIIAEVFE
jgi:crotonobetainyl-CoA:carnitine CoA-transferase CaiB-like acyl-CoA transferase